MRVTLAGPVKTAGLRTGTLQISPASVTRRGDYLLVNLLARNVGDDEVTFWDFLGGGVFAERHLSDPYRPFGSTGVRLLDGGTASYPLDYQPEKSVHACLCDEHIGDKLPPGSQRLISLWYPAPPTGTTAITVDVPDRFRITDVPIS